MNREILFRGKRIDNGEWIYGFYVPVGERNHYILTGKINIIGVAVGFEHVAVDPETVCMFTGLLDGDGMKIFEGDILKFMSGNYVVEWCGKHCKFLQVDKMFSRELHCCINGGEVIGNIHDNPEFLEGD